jgi:hypothetical protein
MTGSPRRRRRPFRGLLTSAVIAVAVLGVAPGVGAAPMPQSCPIATSPGLIQAAGANLGCATSAPFTTNVADQQFEHGRMLWVEEWASISVLYDGGDSHYDAYDDLFSPDKTQPAPLTMPDSPLIEPRQGFGKIWRELGGPTGALGWATADEQSYSATIQYFERGATIQRPDSSAYALLTLNHTRGTWALAGGQ